MSIYTSKKLVYLDNAASTAIDPLVKKEIIKSTDLFGNPSSFNDSGRIARKSLEESRNFIARFIGAKSGEIVFTGSGSESNNLAILGLANSFSKPKVMITTPIEHPSVLEPMRELAKKGWDIKYVKVDSEGIVNVDDLINKLKPGVCLVSVMLANNEIGSVQPINKLGRAIKDFKEKNGSKFPLFHVDACQAVGFLKVNVNNLGADLVTFNGTKIHGPKGIGVLYIRQGTILQPLILGGGQENGLRAGTENLPAINGLARALRIINLKDATRVSKLRDFFISSIGSSMPEVKINGPLGEKRLANNINISFSGVSSENILLELDKYRISASSGSACTAHSVEPSHVLKAIGLEKKYLNGALRFSLGRQTTKKDMDYVLKILPKVVGELRKRYKR